MESIGMTKLINSVKLIGFKSIDYVVTSEEGVSTKMLSSANTQKPGLTATSAAPVGGGGGGTMGGSSY